MMLNLIKETMIDLNGPLSRSIAQICKKRYVGVVGSVCAVQAFVDNENSQVYQIDNAESSGSRQKQERKRTRKKTTVWLLLLFLAAGCFIDEVFG